MSSHTVTTEGGRVSIGSLPSLTPQPGDTVLGMQGSSAGLFSIAALSGNAPDLSGYVKKADSSSFVTESQLDSAITSAIDRIHIPSTDGIAKQADLTAETDARQQADTSIGQRIDGLEKRIDALPSGNASSSGGSATSPAVITSLPTWHGDNKVPVRLFGTIQDDGGAYNNSTVSYPGGVTFKYPPIITGKTYIVSFDDWGKGINSPPSDLVVKSASCSGFTFQHAGPWPGNGQEWIVYSVEGVPN